MEQKKITTKIQGIGEININICKTGKDWWEKEIEDFVINNESGFITIACLNSKFSSNIVLQIAVQNFVNFIQCGGEPQSSGRIRNHFNNWLNKTNGTIGTKSSTNFKGSGLSGTAIIRPGKTFEGTF